MSFSVTSTEQFERVSKLRVGDTIELCGNPEMVYQITEITDAVITLRKRRQWDRIKDRLWLAWITCRERFWEWWYSIQGEPL